AAVAAGDDVLAASDRCEALDALRDDLRVLDEVRRGVDDAGDDHLAFGQLYVLEDTPLMLVTRIGALEGDARGPGRQHGLDDLAQRDVVVVGPLVVTPAE